MTEEDIAVSTMVNNIFDEEKSRKNGTEAAIDDTSEEEYDDDDSLASCNNDGDGDSSIESGDDCDNDGDISVTVIEHEDDDLVGEEEEDDALLLSDDDSIDLAEIGGMDITLDPLDETDRVQSAYASDNKSEEMASGSSDAISEDEKVFTEEAAPKVRFDFNEMTLDILVGKGAKKKSIRLSKINVLASRKDVGGRGIGGGNRDR